MDKTTMLFTEKLYLVLAHNYEDIDFDYGKLCKELNLSRSQVYRCFQEENLGSPSVYLRQFRLEKAKGLLRETELRINEIAFEVGFKSASHFSVSFLEEYGLSPKAYRMQRKS